MADKAALSACIAPKLLEGHVTEVKATAINAPTQATELFIANSVENLIPVTNIPLFLII
jgi:hypothetical protein